MAKGKWIGRTLGTDPRKIHQNCSPRGKNWKQELRQYRATPHSTTGVSPSEALNNRKLKTTIPELPLTQCNQQQSMPQDSSASIAQRDAMQKQKMKIYADLKAHAHCDYARRSCTHETTQTNKTSLAPPTIQSLLLWKKRKVQWSQRVMDHRLPQEILLNSKLFPKVLHRAKRIVERRMKKKHQECSKTLQKPRKTFR